MPSAAADGASRSRSRGAIWLLRTGFDVVKHLTQSPKLMQSKHILSAVLIAGAASLAFGAEPKTQPISLGDCIQLALQHNLDIQITRQDPVIAKMSLSAAYAGYDPAFNFGYRHNYSLNPPTYNTDINQNVLGAQTDSDTYNLGLGGMLPTGLNYNLVANGSDNWGSRGFVAGTNLIEAPFSSGNGYAGIDLRQPLLKNFWIDATRLNIKLSKSNLQQSELGLRQQIMLTVNQVEQAYYALIASRDAVEVQRMALRLAEQLLSEEKKRVEVGVKAPLDERQAESQAEASRAALLGVENEVRTRENDLKTLITDKFSEWQDIRIEPTEQLNATPQSFSRQDSWAKGLTQRPDILSAKIDLEKRNITLKYDKNQLYPQLDLTGTYGRIGASEDLWGALSGVRDGSGNAYSYGLQLSFPLSNRAARQRYSIGKEDVVVALLRLKKKEQSVMVEIDDLIARAQTSFQQITATKAAVEFARQAVEAGQKKLENGKSTSFEVLSLQTDLTQRQYQYLSALTTYNVALANLAYSEGTTLERNNVTIEIR